MQGFCKALFRSVFCESHGHKKTIRFCRYLIWHWLFGGAAGTADISNFLILSELHS